MNKSEAAKLRWKDPEYKKKNNGCKGKNWKLSEETKKKLSLLKKGKTPKAFDMWQKAAWAKNKGRIQSVEEKKKRGLSIIRFYDEKGRKKYKRCIHVRDKKYLEWRSDVFERDKYTCRHCGTKGVYLEAHHILGWSKYSKHRYSRTNGLTLCKKCHKLTDNYKGNGK